MKCDVLVAGGGSAGVAAALAAARTGAKTLLVERHGSLGGMVSASFVHSICGLYLLADDGPAVLANAGFAAEFARRLVEAGGATGPVRMGRVYVLLQSPPAFAALADQLASETPGLEVRFHTEITRAGSGEVELLCRGTREMLQPVTMVDATGDGALAAMCGAEFEMEDGERLQRPAYVFALGGVAEGALEDEKRLGIAHAIASAAGGGSLPAGVLGAALRASGRLGEAYVTIDLDAEDYDPLAPACLATLETHGRELAVTLTRFLRESVEGFGRSFIAAFPARVGIRESRRVRGEYRIETEDVVEGARFEDAVAVSAWPMELRETAKGARLRFPKDNRACDVPLRALQARGGRGLWVAGRCISCSHEAQASLRVIGTCLATGEAAGIAAALVADGRPCDAGAVREKVHEHC